jgi:hypothetical protein
MSPPFALATGVATSQPLIGLAELMSRVFKGENLSFIGQELLARSHLGNAEALLDLSVLLQLQHKKEVGLALQQEALTQQQTFELTDSSASPLRLLAIYTSGDLMTNTPLEFLSQGAGFSLQMLYVAEDLPRIQAIPEHDIAIVGVSELDRNSNALALIEDILPLLHCPILNTPAQIKALARDKISHTLAGSDTIEMPLTLRYTRAQLCSSAPLSTGPNSTASNMDFPVIIRPIDSHAGNNLEKIDNPSQLTNYLTTNTCTHFFVAKFVDYKNSDGQYKKYRVMFIDQQPYVAHMAISDHWLIHYLNAGMVDSAAKRFIEAQVMGSFDNDFAIKHKRAFEQLNQAVGLEYFGIDCAETKEGKLLVFEACASLNIHAMDCEKTFPYKKPQMQKIFDAFLQMLVKRCTTT